MKVLIVDDSVLIRERLKAAFSCIGGVEVAGEAEDQAEAIALARSLRPDVVILDIRLAVGSGIEVLRAIRRDGLPCRVIVLTNYPYPQYREKCKAAGADYFLDKSAEFDKVARVVRRLAGGKTGRRRGGG